MVKHPRRTLREEFDVDIPDNIEIRVWDTSAEVRYMVLPQRPAGTEGMSEEDLADLVTRDSMIGVEQLGNKHVDDLR
jgi:nitrile hydratase